MTNLTFGMSNWATSDNMGKQLLKKAGWCEGEGMGKHKQGTMEHIKVSIKKEKTGIGLNKRPIGTSCDIMQCVKFDNILKSLQNETGIAKTESIPNGNRSESSIVLSRPKFGRRVRDEPIDNKEFNRLFGITSDQSPHKQQSEENNKKSIDKNDEKTDGKKQTALFFESSLSIWEYFDEKIRQKNSAIIIDRNEPNENTEEKNRKSKKRKHEDQLDENNESKKIKKEKKSKKNKKHQEEIVSIDENKNIENGEKKSKKKRTKMLNENETKIDEKKSKKKRTKMLNENETKMLNENETKIDEENQNELQSIKETKSEKNKKKKKKEKTID